MSYNESLIIRQSIPQKNPAPKQTEATNTSEPHTPSVYLRLKTIFTEFLRTFSFFASNAEKKEEKPPFAKAQQLTIATPKKPAIPQITFPLSLTVLFTQLLSIPRISQFFGLAQAPLAKKSPTPKRITTVPLKTKEPTDATQTPSLKPVPLTGFINTDSNGWETSLMQMIINTPSLLDAYLIIGNHYQDKEMGQKLLEAYDAYTRSLETRTPVDAIHSRHVREFFNHLRAPSNPNEALNLLLKKYREVLKERKISDPAMPTFAYSSTIQSTYAPSGNPPSRKKIWKNYPSASDLNPQSRESKSSHITLNFLAQNENSFLSMLSSHFSYHAPLNCAQTEYLLPNGKVQKFQKTGEQQKIQTPPPELILTLPRLRADGIKINNTVDVPLEFKLPKEISPNNDPTYELTSFVVHTGVFSTTGGYVTYRKTEDQWFLCNNENIEAVSIEQVKDALKSSYIHHYKNT